MDGEMNHTDTHKMTDEDCKDHCKNMALTDQTCPSNCSQVTPVGVAVISISKILAVQIAKIGNSFTNQKGPPSSYDLDLPPPRL